VEREAESGARPGDAIFLAPDYRVDPLLTRYVQSRAFRSHAVSTRLNYATDIALFLTFLWGRGKGWREAVERDVEDFEYWRTRASENPERIGGSKWNRELAAFSGLYRWALRERVIARSPVATRQVVGYRGELVTVPAARAKDGRPSNVHWLTPRTWRLWSDVGLRGFGRDGAPVPGWAGRLEDRNTAFVDLLTSSGLRRQEAAALLTIEVPSQRLAGSRYCHGTVASESSRGQEVAVLLHLGSGRRPDPGLCGLVSGVGGASGAKARSVRPVSDAAGHRGDGGAEASGPLARSRGLRGAGAGPADLAGARRVVR
jgi:hypothetical protein